MYRSSGDTRAGPVTVSTSPVCQLREFNSGRANPTNNFFSDTDKTGEKGMAGLYDSTTYQ
jgi:hypothetical protein